MQLAGSAGKKKEIVPHNSASEPRWGVLYFTPIFQYSINALFALSTRYYIFSLYMECSYKILWTIKALGLLVMHFALDNFFVLSILVEGVSLCLATVINNINGEFKIM